MNTQLDPTLLTTILTRARALIEQGWCQGNYAQTILGDPTNIRSDQACRWCLTGALGVSLSEHQQQPLFPQVRYFLRQFTPLQVGPGSYNDAPTTTQQDVLALLDRAIAGVEKQP